MIRRWWRWLWWRGKEWNNDSADGISICSHPQGIHTMPSMLILLGKFVAAPPAKRSVGKAEKSKKEATKEKKSNNNNNKNSNNKHKIYQLARLRDQADLKRKPVALLALWLPDVRYWLCPPSSLLFLGAPAAQLMFQISHFNSIHDILKRQQATGKRRTTTTVAAPWAAAEFLLLLLLLLLLKSKSTQYGKLWRFLLDLCTHPPHCMNACVRRVPCVGAQVMQLRATFTFSIVANL